MEKIDFACEYVRVFKYDDSVSVVFEIEDDGPMAIGARLSEIDERAYMNGYNWSALIHWYLKNNEPDLLDGLDDDSEASTYVGIYDSSDDADKGRRLAETICRLVEDESGLCAMVRDHADEIEWD